MNSTSFEVDPEDPLLTASEANALRAMIEGYRYLIANNQLDRAKGAARMIHIYWASLKNFVPELGSRLLAL